MSSALDITYKTPQKSEASAYISMLGAGLYAAIGNQKLSWSNSIRYKTNKYLLGTLETKGEYMPRFLDYQTYFNYKPTRDGNSHSLEVYRIIITLSPQKTEKRSSEHLKM